MMLYTLRHRFESISVTVGRAASRLKLHPNVWTLLSVVPALATLYFMLNGSFVYAALLLALTASFDVIDGAVARVTGTTTKLGAYLDTMVDRFIEATILFGLALAPLQTPYLASFQWIFLLLFGSMLSTYAKAASAEKGLYEKDLHGMKGGVLEHTDRMLVLFLIVLLLGAGHSVYAAYLLMLAAALANVTALQRIYYTVRNAKQ